MAILPQPPIGWVRKSIPAGVKLVAMFVRYGFHEFDHRPPLSERQFDTDKNDTIPPANDPFYVEAVTGPEHGKRSFGTPATTAGSDANNRAKVRHNREKMAQFNAVMAAKVTGGEPPKPKRKHRWAPGRKLQSRPFQRRKP